jgi:hypothetical protein
VSSADWVDQAWMLPLRQAAKASIRQTVRVYIFGFGGLCLGL